MSLRDKLRKLQGEWLIVESQVWDYVKLRWQPSALLGQLHHINASDIVVVKCGREFHFTFDSIEKLRMNPPTITLRHG